MLNKKFITLFRSIYDLIEKSILLNAVKSKIKFISLIKKKNERNFIVIIIVNRLLLNQIALYSV